MTEQAHPVFNVFEWAADFLVEWEPGSGRFVLPPGTGELPLSFSLRATKPAAS